MIDYIFIAASLLFTLYVFFKFKKSIKYLLTVALSLIYSVVLIILVYQNLPGVLFLLSIGIATPTMVYLYTKHNTLFGISILFIITALLMWVFAYNAFSIPFIQVFSISLLISSFPFFEKKVNRGSKTLETRRDIIQILIGIILLLILYFVNTEISPYIILVLMLLGCTINNFAASSRNGIAKLLKKFERDGILFGKGALYIGIGAMILLGFINNINFVMIGITALFISDALATIVGIRGKHKLGKARHSKSIEGFLSFFLTLSVIGFFEIGILSLVFGAAIAIIESVSGKIDDNITIAIGCVVLYWLIFLVYLYPLTTYFIV